MTTHLLLIMIYATVAIVLLAAIIVTGITIHDTRKARKVNREINKDHR